MDDLIARCIARIRSIIDQLCADLDSISEDADTAEIKAAIRRLEDTLHHLNKI